MGTSSAWTPERRAKQAETIRRNKPWAKSTGPKTPEGKATSSRNADKGGRTAQREELRAMVRHTRLGLKLLKQMIARDGIKPFGPPDQIGRRRQRSPEAAARHEETLFRLYLEMEGLASLLDDDDELVEPQ